MKLRVPAVYLRSANCAILAVLAACIFNKLRALTIAEHSSPTAATDQISNFRGDLGPGSLSLLRGSCVRLRSCRSVRTLSSISCAQLAKNKRHSKSLRRVSRTAAGTKTHASTITGEIRNDFSLTQSGMTHNMIDIQEGTGDDRPDNLALSCA